jgi:hypothetical protein
MSIRVDGRDLLTQPVTAADGILATSGTYEWRWTPRHSAAVVAKFGELTPYLLDAYGDANNWIRVYWSAANTITLDIKCPTLTITRTWDATGAIVAGTTYTGKVVYSPSSIVFYVDNVAKITITTGNYPANWWLSGGISAGDAAVVYQPQFADDLADSYVNLANPGTYNASPGIAPAWTSAGWTFDGTTQYLGTGFVLETNHSMIVAFRDVSNLDGVLVGRADNAGKYFMLVPRFDSVTSRFWNGAWPALTSTPALLNGTMAMAGVTGYKNGLSVGTLAPYAGSFLYTMLIGAVNISSVAQRIAATISAVGVYSRVLSDAEVLAVSNAMLASINLTTLPTTIYWGSKQDGTCVADATFSAPA